LANGSNGKSRDTSSESILLAIDNLLGHLTDRGDLSYTELIEFLHERRQEKESPSVPLSIFRNRSLGSLEALTKFLKEHHSLQYSEIAALLNRDDRTIWSTYDSAQKKHDEPNVVDEDSLWVPAAVFGDRRLGPLEALSIHLRDEHEHSFTEIGRLLNRDTRTIWTTCKRARGKLNRGGAE